MRFQEIKDLQNFFQILLRCHNKKYTAGILPFQQAKNNNAGEK
jgi:hypothetical protein